MLFDAVFYADSEYHAYFAWKSSFGSQNLEIRVQFCNILPPFAPDLEKIGFLSEETKFFQTHAYFCSPSDDDSIDVWILRKSF